MGPPGQHGQTFESLPLKVVPLSHVALKNSDAGALIAWLPRLRHQAVGQPFRDFLLTSRHSWMIPLQYVYAE